MASEAAAGSPAYEDDDIEHEHLEVIPDEEQRRDPLRHAVIRKSEGAESFLGRVEDITRGSLSKERLYLILYDDGDQQHLTEDEVRACQVDEDFPGAPPRDLAQERGGEEEGARKRPAAAVSEAQAKAKAKAKAMGGPKAKGKAKGKATAKGKGRPKGRPKGKAKAGPKGTAKAKGRPKAKAGGRR